MKLVEQITNNVSDKQLYQDYIDTYKAVKTYFGFIYKSHPTNIVDIICNVVGKHRFQLHVYSYMGDEEDWGSWDRTVQIGWDNSSVGYFSCKEFEYDYEKVSKQIEYYENKLKEIEAIENSFENVINNLINKINEINYV